MSENVVSYGFLVMVETAITKELEKEEVGERLYFEHDLNLSYSGTIVYTEMTRSDDPAISCMMLSHGNDADRNAFLEKCKAAGIIVDPSTVRAYKSRWYNGADSYIAEMETLDTYNDARYQL